MKRLNAVALVVLLPLVASGAVADADAGAIAGQSYYTHERQGRLVLLGDPGSGKTTLLKTLASGVSSKEWPEYGRLIPVFVSLRHYADRAITLPSVCCGRREERVRLYDQSETCRQVGRYARRNAGRGPFS